MHSPRYKGNDLRANEDSAGFIDQEERSNLYDDFESKDVVKRGISGAEDYEEVDDDAVEAAEDIAALEENSSIQDEETEKREVQHSDVRVKREHDNSKGESENAAEAPEEKSGNLGASGESSSDRKTAETSSKRDTVSDKDNKAAEASGKDSNDQSKRDAVEKSENCDRDSKQQLGSNDSKSIGEKIQTVKIQNEQGLNSGIATDARAGNQETDLLPNKALNDLVSDSSRVLEGTAKKSAESKVANAAGEDPARLENSRNAATADEDYQKRVEEQIQRKIDSIKEQIKREIEESQRLREIEENNAKFDELRQLEEDEREASLAGEDASKSSDKSQTRENTVKRSTKRSKRHNNAARIAEQESEISSKKSPRGTTTRKRSTTKSESRVADEVPRKRARQAFLVRTDRKKRRRRRSRSSEEQLIPEQRNVKLEDSLPADLSLDSNLREALDAGKVKP